MSLLRDALSKPDPDPLVWLATITSIDAGGTVGIDLGGGRTIDVASVLSSYTPRVGDVVQVLRRDGSTWLVLGDVRDSNQTTVDVTTSLSFPFNVAPAAPAVANPFVVDSNNIQSWRNNEGWSGAAESNNAAQGAFSTTWGYYRGCYFYGSTAFSALKGATCTGITIRLHRDGSGGIAGGERQWIAPHTHATQPSGAPYFPVGATNVGSLAWNGIGTFALPTIWGQRLIDGVYKGFGHLYLGTADYSICVGLGSDALSGRLSISWA